MKGIYDEELLGANGETNISNPYEKDTIRSAKGKTKLCQLGMLLLAKEISIINDYGDCE